MINIVDLKANIIISWLFILLIFSSYANAKAYKCEINGKTTYQQTPCLEGGSELKIDKPPSDTGNPNQYLIRMNKVAVGMTERDVILSWGKPDKINRSSSSDQWIYRRDRGNSQYVHFRNGIVSYWSNN